MHEDLKKKYARARIHSNAYANTWININFVCLVGVERAVHRTLSIWTVTEAVSMPLPSQTLCSFQFYFSIFFGFCPLHFAPLLASSSCTRMQFETKRYVHVSIKPSYYGDLNKPKLICLMVLNRRVNNMNSSHSFQFMIMFFPLLCIPALFACIGFFSPFSSSVAVSCFVCDGARKTWNPRMLRFSASVDDDVLALV